MITAIVNPVSANGKTASAWPDILTALEAELGIVQVQFTKERYHAAELTRQAIRLGATTIVVVGGDGTINEVVNGICQQPSSLNLCPKLAIILRGTGADFARCWETRPSIVEIARSIRRGESHPCDVVRMRLNPIAEGSRERYYINIADVGIGGQVVEIVNNSPKFLGGTLSFFLASLRATLFQYRNMPMHIELDGKVISAKHPYYFVAIANGQYFGGGMHIAPEARYDDGVFDVVLVGDLRLPEKFYFAAKLYQGKANQLRKITTHRGRRLTISSPQKVFIEADGELVGTTDAHFEIIPSALNILGWIPRS